MTRAEFRAYKERSLNRFCYEVIKNEGADARREIARRIRKEINFAAVDPAVLERMSTEDTYNLDSHVFLCPGIYPYPRNRRAFGKGPFISDKSSP